MCDCPFNKFGFLTKFSLHIKLSHRMTIPQSTCVGRWGDTSSRGVRVGGGWGCTLPLLLEMDAELWIRGGHLHQGLLDAERGEAHVPVLVPTLAHNPRQTAQHLTSINIYK